MVPARASHFPRSARLTSPQAYRHVFRKARKQSDDALICLFVPNQMGEPRLGFAISRRRIKRAVDRNRIRRIAREAFRHRRADLPAVDIVVLARESAAQLDKRDLGRRLNRLFRGIERCAGC